MRQPDRSTSQPLETTRTVYKNWRERFVTPLLVGALVFGLLALFPAVSSSTSAILDGIFIGVYVIIGLVTFIRFPYGIRIGVFLFTIYALGVSELFSTGILGDSLFFFLGFIVLSTMLYSPRAGMASAVITLATFGMIGWLSLSNRINFINPGTIIANLQDWLSASATTLLFAVVIISGFRRLEVEFLDAQNQIDETLNELKLERNNLENNVADRTQKLRKVNDIASSISSILVPEELLTRATQIIGDEFDCYYTAIFLLDTTGQWAELKEATGDTGRVLRENKYRVDVNGKNTIGTAIRLRKPRIALDTGDEPARFDNPLLPYTRSQIALPLIVGDRILGALELQSTKGSAFSNDDLDTYQNMANQVAIAMDNARLFHESQRSLTELQATQRQYLQGAWSTLASEQNLEYRLGDEELTGQTNELTVPLMLRDQIIGQIFMASNEEWTSEQKSLIESIATQATLALENARLVEEGQSTAMSERLVNEIISKVWSSTTIDGIMQTTVRELGRAMDASEVNIEIKMGDSNG